MPKGVYDRLARIIRGDSRNQYTADPNYDPNGMTDHERQVLEMHIIHGPEQAAYLLNMKPGTVRGLVSSIKEKLGVTGQNRVQLYHWYRENYGYEPRDHDSEYDGGRYNGQDYDEAEPEDVENGTDEQADDASGYY